MSGIVFEHGHERRVVALRRFGWLRSRPGWKQLVLAAALLAIAGELLVMARSHRRGARLNLQIAADTKELRMLIAAPQAAHDEAARRLENDIARASRELADDLESFRRSAPDDPGTSDSVQAFLDLMRFVGESRLRAAAASVEVRSDEHFGFWQYRHQGPAAADIPTVQRQRRLIESVLEMLLTAKPLKLLAIQRRAPRDGGILDATDAGSAPDFFAPESSLVDGCALFDRDVIRISFTGDTACLRRFLNQLSLTATPWLAVRRIETAPSKGDDHSGDAALGVNEFTVTIEEIWAKNPLPGAELRAPRDPGDSTSVALVTSPAWPETGEKSERGLFTPPPVDTRARIAETAASAELDAFVAGLRLLGMERRIFRVQLGGWIGDTNSRRALLLKTGTPETRVVAVGQAVPEWAISLVSLEAAAAAGSKAPDGATAVVADQASGREITITSGTLAYEHEATATLASSLSEPRNVRSGDQWIDGGFSLEALAIAAAEGDLTLRVTRIDSPEETRTTVLKLSPTPPSP